YGKHLADIWQGLLVPRNSDNARLKVEPLVEWLEKRFNDNLPWDQFVTELLTASGEQEENGAGTLFVANQSPDKITDLTARLFLGVQLQCAQCHNHPFTKWKQTEYWGMAAFFMKVQANGTPRQAMKRGVNLAVSEESGGGKGKAKKAKLPESAQI